MPLPVRAVLAAVLIAAGVSARPPRGRPEAADRNPEAATGYAERELVRAPHFMMVSANPWATRAGDEMLRAGGSAVDAAIAAQLVLNGRAAVLRHRRRRFPGAVLGGAKARPDLRCP